MPTTDRGARAPVLHSDEHPELCARMTTTNDGMTECTIFPKHLSIAEQSTTWITALEGSYVDVRGIR